MIYLLFKVLSLKDTSKSLNAKSSNLLYNKYYNLTLDEVNYGLFRKLFTTTINLNIYLICIIAIIYIMIHQNRHRQFNQYLDVYLNYIPVLTHEFGHVLFNKNQWWTRKRFSHRHTAFGTTSNDATRLCYYPIQGSLDNSLQL